MKVLAVIPTFEKGGAERVMSMLSAEWARRHDVTVCTFDSRARAYRMDGRTIDLNLSAAKGRLGKAVRFAGRILALRNVIRRSRPDLMVSFMESANLPMIAACASTGRLDRLTISVRVAPASMCRLYRAVARIAYRFPGRVVGPSAGLTDDVRRRFAVPATRCATICNPVDVDRIRAAASTPPPHPRPYVIAAGRLDAQKGLDVLLHAFANIASSVTHDLLLVGDGPERANLERLARDLHLAPRVVFVGLRDDPWRYMHHCDAFVLPSRFEGWPNALVEAMACGRPVVACDCDFGPREIIRDGIDGLLTPVEDPAALAQALLRVLRDRTFASRLAEAAAASARAYAAPAIADRWLS